MCWEIMLVKQVASGHGTSTEVQNIQGGMAPVFFFEKITIFISFFGRRGRGIPWKRLFPASEQNSKRWREALPNTSSHLHLVSIIHQGRSSCFVLTLVVISSIMGQMTLMGARRRIE
jgi:hypothetical protein